MAARAGHAGLVTTTTAEIFEGETRDPHLLAIRAYVWGFALIAAARLRQLLTSPQDPFVPRLPTSGGAPLNNMGHQRRLSDPTLPGVAPNVDTLYSLAWLDLAREPFVLETPDFGSRYYCFQIGHADTASELSLGTRTHGGRLPPLFIYGPENREPTPHGMLAIPSHTRYLMIAGRTLVKPDDPSDFDAVRELQERIQLRLLSKYLAGESAPNDVPPQRLLDDASGDVDADLGMLTELGNLLQDWYVAPGEQGLVESFGAIGITVESGFTPELLAGAAKREGARGLADGAELVEVKSLNLGTNVNGWTINYRGPRFGDDYLLRAAVARDQPYVNVPEEAVYPVAAVDADGRPLSGDDAYRLSFAPGALPPVDAFWSLTMYTRNGPPLVPNPIGRYAIGDRTRGLVAERDGSLAIQVQHAEPAAEGPVNWLPAPQGAFHVMLRLYIPHASALDGSWVPPPLERVDVVERA
jgi:hypothetical protein